MSKAKLLLTGAILSLFSLFNIPTTSHAQFCSLTTTPSPLVIPSEGAFSSNTNIAFKIAVGSPGKYDVYFRYGALGTGLGEISFKDLIPDSNNLLGGITINPNSGKADLFNLGKHFVDVKRQGAPGTYCQVTYEVLSKPESQQIECSISTVNPTNDNTEVKFNGFIKPSGKYRLRLTQNNQEMRTAKFTTDAQGTFPEQNLGVFNPGVYQIFVQQAMQVQEYADTLDVWVNTNCQVQPLVVHLIKDNPNPSPPTTIGLGTTSPAGTITVKQCKSKDDPTFNKEKDTVCALAGGESCDASGGRGPGIKTAIGCIHTSPAEFIKDFLTFIIGIGGGLAFVMMLLGAFQMLTSAGNPETLSAGKDRLQSAIIGLLFVVFAVLLLQIIGVDILKIPGFGR